MDESRALSLLALEPGASREDVEAACARWGAVLKLSPRSAPGGLNEESLAEARGVLLARTRSPAEEALRARARLLRRSALWGLLATALTAWILVRPQTETWRPSPPEPRLSPVAGSAAVLDMSPHGPPEDRPPSPLLPPAPAPPPEAGAPADMRGEQKRQYAVHHWTKGIVAYQKRDWAEARKEWELCRGLDPDNADCPIGLLKLDQTPSGRAH